MIRFSLIICVYAKEESRNFRLCIESVLTQSVLPDEWIIVKDGSLTDGLEAVIRGIPFSVEFKIVALPENVTQGPARAAGIEVAEFYDDPRLVRAVRAVPLEHSAILRRAALRNPFNSMTVMLRRDLALAAGNFRYFPWFEDYDLWTRMIKAGAVCANHPDVLVNMRVGGGMYERRRGASYIRSELRMQRQLRELGVIGNAGYIRNLALRVPPRLLPARGIATLYNQFARKKIEESHK